MKEAAALAALGLTLVVGAFTAQAASAAEPQFYANNVKLSSTPRNVFAWGEIALPAAGLKCTALVQALVWNSGERAVGEVTSFNTDRCQSEEFEPLLTQAGKPDFCTPERGCGNGPIYLSAEEPLRLEREEGEVCAGGAPNLRECDTDVETERERASLITRVARRSSLPWSLTLTNGERSGEQVHLLEMGQPGASCYPKEDAVVEGNEVERPVGFEKVPAGCVKIDVIAPLLPAEFDYYGRLEITLTNGLRNGLTPSRLEFIEAGSLQDGGGLEEPTGAITPVRGTTPVEGEMTLEGFHGLEVITAK